MIKMCKKPPFLLHMYKSRKLNRPYYEFICVLKYTVTVYSCFMQLIKKYKRKI